MLRRLTSLVASFLLVGMVLVPVTVSAYDPFDKACDGAGSTSTACGSRSGGDDPIAGSDGIIVNVTTILAIIAGIVSVIFLVWGGVKYITSGGDSGGVSSAKNTVIAAIVGLLIAALARPIVVFIISKL